MGEGHCRQLFSFCLTNILTIALRKLQGNVRVTEGGRTHAFFHPYMQTQMMIIGMVLCIVPYWLQEKSSLKTDKPKVTIKLYILPLVFDLLSSCLIFAGMYYVSGSLYSLLSSLVMVFTSIFSYFMLSFIPTKTQLLGCFLTIIGAALAGIGQSMQDQKEANPDLVTLGIVLLIIAFAIQALQITISEQIYSKYDVNPLHMVGCQGIIGTAVWSILLIVFKCMDCPFPEEYCVADMDGFMHVEDFLSFFISIGDSWYLLVLMFSFVLLVARFNYDLILLIMNTSAVMVCIVSIFSEGLLWIIGLMVTLLTKGDEQFKMQSLDVRVNLFKLVGFIITTLALFIYNKVIVLECLEEAEHKEETFQGNDGHLTPKIYDPISNFFKPS